jgi:LuxR family maltose regulon positive regulatory protein
MVRRSRLIERLNEGLSIGRKLTLISASAGFGKTTLVSEWIDSCKEPVAWLSLDGGDNDPNRFLTYLIAALQTLTPGNGGASFGAKALAMLQSPQPLPIETILTTLINDIIPLSDSFILVLDDYHVIDSKQVDEALTFLIEHAPPQLHMVITTREDPHLPLARLRTRGQLTELRAVDLRFTSAEAAAFLNQIMSLNLKDADIAALESRTEGWIAGLQLASLAMQGLSMQGQQDTASFIQAFTGSHHFVLDFLLEEVLQQQPESIQTFLLRTSILDRLCGPLCDAVLNHTAGSGQATAGQQTEGQSTPGQLTLEYLERANLFIISLDNERRWYRYHHLFGDILRQRLGQRRSPAEIAEHHLRASMWYEKNDDWAEAIQHAFAAGDFHRVAGLAEKAYQSMDNRFQTAAWLGWAKKLPEDVVRIRPVLLTQMAQAFMGAGELEASEDCLQAAEQCMRGSSGQRIAADEAQLAPLPSLIAMTRAYNAQVRGDLSATVKYAELALQRIPEDNLFSRAQATITLEVVNWTRGDLEAARSALVDWINSMQKAGNFVFAVASAFALADILVVLGRLREAVQTYQQALQRAAKHGKDAQQITAHHYLGLALLYHEMGEDTAAAEHLQKAEEMGKQTTLVDWSYRWLVAQARLKESRGDLESALALLDEARPLYVKTLIPYTHPIDALKANIYLKQGRLDQAQDWVRKRGLSTDDAITYLNEFEHLVLARGLIAQYQSGRSNDSLFQSIGLLERLLKAAEAQSRTGSVIEILVTQAVARFASANHQAAALKERENLTLALASLERALALAEPEGYLRHFVDEGEPVHSLLLDFRTRMERQPIGQGHALLVYVERLLSAFGSTEEIYALARPQKVDRIKPEVHAAKIALFEPLSERELEVLRLLRTELSGPEIASQLVISPNTFRTHTRNIFSKLGATNRRAAVRRAEELDLF